MSLISLSTESQTPPRAGAKPELLAPAGDRDCLRAAVENGADAVYFGLKGHNARARATNFGIDELPGVMGLLHRRGMRGYVTLNTLVFPRELDDLENTLRRVAEAGVDAVIVQDLGLVRLARDVCPDLPVHASTQMTLTSAASIRVAEELGVERVILARELSLAEIRRIRSESPMPLEVFVHGALCVAYSGQCLTSEALGGRSANRGQCAQACRLPYELVCDGETRQLGDVQYLLSPQDLAAYDVIPQLIELGMAGLKIEGRLKTPEYVANITRHYRMALDSAAAGRPVVFTRREVNEMELSFSRGFSSGWFHGNNHKVLVQGRNPRKHGLLVGEVQAVRRGRVLVSLRAPLKRGDGVVFDRGRPEETEQGGRIYELFVGGESVEGELSSGAVELAFGRGDLQLAEVRPGHLIWKTDDPELTRRLRRSFAGSEPRRRVAIDVWVRARVGMPLAVGCRAESGVSASLESPGPLAAAQRHPVSVEFLRTQLGRLGRSGYLLRSLEADIQGEPMVPLSVIGQLRHEMIRQLDESADRLKRRSVSPEPVLPAARRAIWQADEGITDIDPVAPGSSVSRPLTPDPSPRKRGEGRLLDETAPELRVLCRSLGQLAATVDAGVRSVYADFQDIRGYAEAVAVAHRAGLEIYLATPRIEKPAEAPLFRHLLRHGADGILVRNLGGLAFFARRGVPMAADFSLNAANELSVALLRGRGAGRIVPSYDLNHEQLFDLAAAVPPGWIEVVVHQHMPMFHMEHCVFCAFLSPGTDRTNCGRPCDRHDVRLRDRVGMEHTLRADVGCRNTLFNAVPQSAAEHVPALLARGVRQFRIELLNDSAPELRQTIGLYRDLLAGRARGREVWTRLRATNRVGVTRGPLDA